MPEKFTTQPAEVKTTKDRDTQQTVDNLVLRLKEGDKSAWVLLYEKHFRNVRNTCMLRVRNMAIAEELAQNVFMALPETIQSFKGTARLSTWLHTVADRTALMYLDKASTRREISSDESEMGDLMALRQKNIPHYLEEQEILRRIARARAVDQLTEKERLIYRLDEEGYTDEEIAIKLGVVAGTIKSRLFKIKKKLKKLLLE